ncbi:hypothetical protein ACFL2T_00735 [Elusimicrobiota bacterium]
MEEPECEGKTDDIVSSASYLRQLAERQGLPHHALLPDENPKRVLEGAAHQMQAQDYVRLLFSDRPKAEKSIVRQLLNEIVLREKIRDESFHGIDQDICECGTWLNEIRAIREKSYVPVPEESLIFGARRTTLELRVLELEGERRKEEVDSWRDLSTLRRYLLFALRDYWSAARRKQLLLLGEATENETSTA